jgi:predicted methyltransferase
MMLSFCPKSVFLSIDLAAIPGCDPFPDIAGHVVGAIRRFVLRIGASTGKIFQVTNFQEYTFPPSDGCATDDYALRRNSVKIFLKEQLMFISHHSTTPGWMPSILAVLGLILGVNGYASAQSNDAQAVSKLYEQAVDSPIRTDADRDADAKRKPLEFLEFTKAQPGMKVLDVATGAGYTTQLLALVVGSNGTVWAQGPKLSPALEKRLASHPQANIVPVVQPFDDPVPGDSPKLDLITIIMNYHDIAYMPVDRAKMDQRLFDVLKPGGHLVVLDHSAKAGSGISVAKTLHRIDEAVVLDEFRRAGFKLEQESDFMRNPADPRDQAFFDTDIDTDKFALRFVKP